MSVVVVSTASTGASVAVEVIGTAVFQHVKLIDGAPGSTTPFIATTAAPAAAEVGLVVRPIGGVTEVSGTVGVSGTVSVVGTVSVSGVAPWTTGNNPWFSTAAIPVVLNQSALVTIGAFSATVRAEVSGTVSIFDVSGTSATTGIAASSTGLLVVVKPGLSVTAAVTGTIQNIASLSTILGTAVVSVVPGVSVNLGSLATVVGTTTAASGATGPIVWLGASQTVLISTQVSGTISVSNTVVVTLATGGSVTLVGTVGVSVIAALSISSIVPVTTQSSVSVSGVPVWWNPSATVNVSGVIPAVTTQSNATGAPIWLCPTQTINVTVASSVVVVGRAGQVIVTVTNTSVLATSTTQFALLTAVFDQYTSSALVSGYTVRQPMAMTGITVVYSATSVTVPSVVFALYATTSGVSITSAGAMILWSTVFPTMTGAAVSTTLNFPATILLPANGVIGLACYRVTTASTVANIAFTLVGQYLN